MTSVPFNVPTAVGRERAYIDEALKEKSLAGDGLFTIRCERWLEEHLRSRRALLTPSCTAALEMSALLLDIQPGDEVIMPSFTFVSTANAFVLRGAVPVFVDVRSDTLNIDEGKIEAAITPRTRAIVVVHYAGEACEMDAIMAIASRHNIPVVEDAAQALLSTYRGRPLGGIGRFGCISFHTSKNILCGEGGALLIQEEADVLQSEIIREKGTNRSQFIRGDVQKYTWIALGSSYLLGELPAAYLLAQLENASAVCARRVAVCAAYRRGLAKLEEAGLLQLPLGTSQGTGNGHIFYALTRDHDTRDRLLSYLKDRNIVTMFHYVPLHSSPAGLRYGRAVGSMAVTDSISSRIVRLPLFATISDEQVQIVVDAVQQFFN
jgi:dTDP-4-amino-4,6-dideoxygalactose transaminase